MKHSGSHYFKKVLSYFLLSDEKMKACFIILLKSLNKKILTIWLFRAILFFFRVPSLLLLEQEHWLYGKNMH